MPENHPTSLDRKLLWSLGSTLFLLFVSSTSTLSNEHQPDRPFSLGLEQAFASRLRFDSGIAAGADAGVVPATEPVPDPAFLISIALRIGGSSPSPSNATSMTGPMTWTILPVRPPWPPRLC